MSSSSSSSSSSNSSGVSSSTVGTSQGQFPDMSGEFTQNPVLMEPLMESIQAEVSELLAGTEYASFDLPLPTKSRQLKQADVTFQMNRQAAALKMKPNDLTAKLAEELTAKLSERGEASDKYVVSVDATAGYLNVMLNRPLVYKLCISAVQTLGTFYGKCQEMKGKTALVEHTSSNPNAPLHIGNLRNVLVGSHLTQLLAAVGYNVRQHFYVNDLGAQIGLTALGYTRIYEKLEPQLKIDQWIGLMYAIMNTFAELQKCGVDLTTLEEKLQAGTAVEAGEGVDAKLAEKLPEWLDIYADLKERQPELHAALLAECISLDEPIKVAAGKLNLAYERCEPEAVAIFRKMVNDCLAGIQKTLDTYRVRHDQWDYESELGWDGSNDQVLDIMKSSPYFTPPTDKNDKGVPEGGYLALSEFISDAGLPVGKKGYQKKYPNLYVLRPDYSTLYTFRDVVYSLKKEAQADMIINVICAEQNLAQEKVALSLNLLHPQAERKMYHLNYEVVKLTTGKMSGRRGRYLLADELYNELRSSIQENMEARESTLDEEQEELVLHEVSTAAMKYALLSSAARTVISFDIKKVTSFEDSSAPFLLYNSARFNTLFHKFDAKVERGDCEPLPSLEDIDYSLLDDQQEWELFLTYVLEMPSMVKQAALPKVPSAPQLPDFGLHKVSEFVTLFVRDFSSYYARVRILQKGDGIPSMHARIHLVRTFKTVIENCLRLLTIEPMERM